jgi:hypothetical protein
MNERFGIRAVKLTECVLQTTTVKDVSESEFISGIEDGSITVDMAQGEIRRGKDVLAKFGVVELPAPTWKVLVSTHK